MKTIKILIASLLLVSQSYAFGKGERNLLLGIGVGAVVATVLHSNDVRITNIPHTKRVYVDTHHERKAYQKQLRKEERRQAKEERRQAHYNSHHNTHRYSKHDKHHQRDNFNQERHHHNYAYYHRY